MKRKQVLWIILAVLAGAAFLALTFAIEIVRREGFEGLWNRKKNAAKSALPGSEKTLEEGERAFKKYKDLYQAH